MISTSGVSRASRSRKETNVSPKRSIRAKRQSAPTRAPFLPFNRQKSHLFPRSVRKGECANNDRTRVTARNDRRNRRVAARSRGRGPPAANSSRANTFYCNFRVVIVTSNERAVWWRRIVQGGASDDCFCSADAKVGMMRGEFWGRGLVRRYASLESVVDIQRIVNRGRMQFLFFFIIIIIIIIIINRVFGPRCSSWNVNNNHTLGTTDVLYEMIPPATLYSLRWL